MSTILECKNLSKAYGNKTALSHRKRSYHRAVRTERQRQNDTDQTDQRAFNAKRGRTLYRSESGRN